MFLKKILGSSILLLALMASLYGLGRFYYKKTAGFTISNITSQLNYHPEWETHPLKFAEQEELKQALNQKFTYLGKGCQSYVFISDDQQYVIKFVKYQRFRPQVWLDYLTFIPGIENLRLKKIEKKRKKLAMLFESWKLAFDHLQKETGLVYVHMNKTDFLNQTIHIQDKIGFEHYLNADQMEFLLQKKADMLCSKLDQLISMHRINEAREVLVNLVTQILSEYRRGYADNDHALMQNTGVVGLQPVHIDVGQFVMHPEIIKDNLYQQELFSKTFKFRKWLLKKSLGLSAFFDSMLEEILGDNLYTLKPIVKNHAWSMEDIPN